MTTTVAAPRRTALRSVRQVLVRHGQCYANLEERFQGQTDTALTPRGQEQADRLAQRLMARFPSVAAVLASDLGRVTATAGPYLAATGAAAYSDQRLRELDTGSWSGRTFADVTREHPAAMAALAAGEDVRRGGGETFADLRERVSVALDEHAARVAATRPATPELTIIVFTHGGPIRVAAASAMGLPAGGQVRLSGLANCSITIITRWLDPVGTVAAGDLVIYNT